METDEANRAFPIRNSLHLSGTPDLRVAPEDSRDESPLVSDLARAIPWRQFSSVNPKITLRIPFAVIAVLLGLSLWFIANKWYGGEGGLLALTLYCFSPAVVVMSSTVRPAMLASWGYYGAIFLAVATAHSLYASAGTLALNRAWRNPLLFGAALGVGMAAQFWVVLSVPIAFAYAMYLVPGRRRDAALKLAAGCAVAALILLAVYDFGLAAAIKALREGRYAAFSLPTWRDVGASTIVLGVAFTIAIVAWLAARRVRHFSNTAALVALVVAIFFVPARAQAPVVTVFAAMFVGGAFADVMQTRSGRLWRGVAFLIAAAAAGAGLRTVGRM